MKLTTLKFMIATSCLALFISGCGGARVGYTVFLREDSSRLYNLKGETCAPSGYQIDEDGHRLITSYENCELHIERLLKEFEVDQWKPAKK